MLFGFGRFLLDFTCGATRCRNLDKFTWCGWCEEGGCGGFHAAVAAAAVATSLCHGCVGFILARSFCGEWSGR